MPMQYINFQCCMFEFCLDNHGTVVTSLLLRFCELASVLDSNVRWLARDGEELHPPLYREKLVVVWVGLVVVWVGLSEALVLIPPYKEI